jgi:hypothetical protein
MPALAHVDLEVESYALTTTANSTAGTSSSLTSGTEYLVIGQANASNTGGDGTDTDMEFRIGATAGSRTVFGRMAAENGAFSPSGALASPANGGNMGMGLATVYTPGAGEEMELQAWAGAASGEAYGRFYAIDISGIPDTGDSPLRWHEETANNDTIVTTPTTGYTVVGNALTFTPTQAGDHVIIASVELVDDGTGGETDEFDCRVVVDGTEVSGSVLQINVASRGSAVYGYLFMRVVNLTAAEHDIEIEVNGTSSNGNVGARRVRIHAIDVNAFEAADVDQDLDATGFSVTGTADNDAMSVTVGNGTDDYLLFMSWQKQVSFWSEAYFLVGAGETETPTEGFGKANDDFGVAVGNDMQLEVGIHVLSSPASSTNIQARASKVGGGGDNDFGAACARAAGGDMGLIGIRLASPDATTLTPTAERKRWNEGTETTVAGAVSQSPTAQRNRWNDGAESTLAGAVSQNPVAQRKRWNEGAESTLVGGVTQSPAAERARYSLGVQTLIIGAVALAPTAENLRWVAPVVTPDVGGGATTLTPTPDAWQWSAPEANVVGTVRPAAERWRWTAPVASPTMGAVSVVPTAARWRWTPGAATLPGFGLVLPLSVVVDTAEQYTAGVDTRELLTVGVDNG